jgi:hypothetical protein
MGRVTRAHMLIRYIESVHNRVLMFAEFTENFPRLSAWLSPFVHSTPTLNSSRHLLHSCRRSFNRTPKLLHPNTISVLTRFKNTNIRLRWHHRRGCTCDLVCLPVTDNSNDDQESDVSVDSKYFVAHIFQCKLRSRIGFAVLFSTAGRQLIHRKN